MKVPSAYVFAFASFVSLFCHCQNLEDDLWNGEDKEGWVDPHDMLNYDPKTKTMKNADKFVKSEASTDSSDTTSQPKQASDLETEKGCPVLNETEFKKCKDLLNVCQQETKNLRSAQQHKKDVVDASLYLKQYVNTLLRYVMFKIPEGQKQQLNYVVELTSNDLLTLENYASTQHRKGNIQDVSAVLNNMIHDVRPIEKNVDVGRKFERTFGIDPTSLLQVCAALASVCGGVYLLVQLRLSLLQMIFNVFILLFIISVPWNWWHLYKKKLAERYSELLKDIPAECSPKTSTVSTSIVSFLKYQFTFSEDECTKYHEKVMVDPMWEVAPTKALAVTITKFFVEPLEHIGEAISKFIKATLQDLPFYMWPVVLLFILFIIIFVLIISRGYKVNLLGPLLGIEPGTYHPPVQQIQDIPAPSQPAIQPPQIYNQEIHENIQSSIQQGLQREIHRITETIAAQQPPCIEAPPTIPVQPVSKASTYDYCTDSLDGKLPEKLPTAKAEKLRSKKEDTDRSTEKIKHNQINVDSIPASVMDLEKNRKSDKTCTDSDEESAVLKKIQNDNENFENSSQYKAPIEIDKTNELTNTDFDNQIEDDVVVATEKPVSQIESINARIDDNLE